MKRRKHVRGESGQVATAIVLVVVVGMIAVGLFGVFAVSRGADERAKSQSAADAAALAGADALTDVIPGIFDLFNSKGDLGSAFRCGLGRSAADDFASRNDAYVTSYCYDAHDDEVRVSVRMNDPVTDDVGPATAKAVASTGLDLGNCSWRDDEPPSPSPSPSSSTTPTPSPSPPTTPPPPPDTGTTLTCGGLRAVFEVDGETGRLRLVDLDLDPLKPRLTH